MSATFFTVRCVDLFHSTDFGTCMADGGAGCAAADGATAADARRHGDAADAGHAKRDAGRDASDARAEVGVGGHDAAHDAGRDAHDARPDRGDAGEDADAGASDAAEAGQDAPPPVDAGTDFCAWTGATAEAHAAHACLWLGACAGNAGPNEFGTCYPNALLAYDCALNPNQRVQGALHAYWDSLSTAETCAAVLAAIFPGGVPSCAATSASGCGLAEAGAYGDIAITCADGGGLATAVNCGMLGYACATGACTNGGAPCAQATAGTCAGNVFHSCQEVENDAGTETVLVDVGKDCTYFGAGACVTAGDAGGGCLPNDAGEACAPSAVAACAAGDTVVTGCATGHEETLRCAGFGADNTCTVMGPWAVSSNQLAPGCYNPQDNGLAIATDSCNAIAAFSDYAGPAGNLQVRCGDAGLGSCTTTKVSGYRPVCSAPP